jgi:hypothetical protein
MHGADPVKTLCNRSGGGTKDSVGSRVPYREAVGCLMYPMTATHSDSFCSGTISSSNGPTN